MTTKNIVRDNAPIFILAFAYIATIEMILAYFHNGHDFLKIYWFDPKIFLLGTIFCVLCLTAQFLVPKFRPCLKSENYIQLFFIILILSPYESAFANYKQYITDNIWYTYDYTFMTNTTDHTGRRPRKPPPAGRARSRLQH